MVEKHGVSFDDFPGLNFSGEEGRQKPVQGISSFLARYRVEPLAAIVLPACGGGRDKGLRFFQGGCVVQIAFVMYLLPDHVPGGLLHFVDLEG